MIKVENIDVFNFEGAIRGMRNPLNSWDKSDSRHANRLDVQTIQDMKEGTFILGEKDLDLMRKLYKAGSEHRKYLRQIFVSMDITAPLYWWKEMDQYRINVTTNSCSTMHKIAAKEFTLDDFSHEHLIKIWRETLKDFVIPSLNMAREEYLATKNKEIWWQMIQLLPSSYNQRRTITMNYENVINMIKQRTGHKLDEWNNFVNILKTLPYITEITGE